MKKGRHRRFEEARALKRGGEFDVSRALNSDQPEKSTDPCAECGAAPGAAHAAWCRAMEEDPYDGYAAGDEELA